MLNIGFTELLLILVAAVLLIRPKDYPTVIKTIARFVRQLRDLVDSVRAQVDGVMEDTGIKERKKRPTITDLEGQEQETYELGDLLPKDKA